MTNTQSFPRKLLNMWRDHRQARAIAEERAAIAKAFNDRYTYRERWKEDGQRLPGTGMYGFTPLSGNAWMCPECNHVHLAESCSVFSGLQYPACCSTHAGHRHDRDIRMK